MKRISRKAGVLALPAALTVLFLCASNAQDAPRDVAHAAPSAVVEAPPYAAPNPGEGLKFTQGPEGLSSLKYNGEELLFKHFGGVDLFNSTPKFAKADGTVYTNTEKATVDGDGETVTQAFSWGRIQARYFGDPSRLTIRLMVENTSNEEIQSLELRLAVLKFPETPTGAVIDVGMWGNGGVGKLGSYPTKAGGKKSPPVVAIQSPVALMHFCRDTNDEAAGLGIPFSADGITRCALPFVAYIGAIPAGDKRELTYSLRFSPDGPISFAAARDVLDSFAKKKSFHAQVGRPATYRYDVSGDQRCSR
jgi:hypothetical protein